MEKSTPHCKLTLVKELIAEGKYRATRSAREGATALGLTDDEMLGVINALTTKDFFKSMTTHQDHKVWQDVYKPTTPDGLAVYVKLTVVEDVLIVSFKEL
jgi:motility quorum-sensing regulator / GCU-specific mRNA interferase toxin